MTEGHAAPLALLIPVVALTACGERATLPVSAGIGPDPVLPPPAETLIPTVDIAPATGWPEGAAPEPAEGLRVAAFAADLEHPRWLYVLPNGDVLVAETGAPPQPEDKKGLKGWVMGLLMEKAGAAVPSADRITLLRDADGDGEVETRSVFLDDLHSPFGMTLVGDDFYVANTDALVRFPYGEGQTRIEASGEKVADLPAGPINRHWTKSVVASPDGALLYVGVGSNSNVAENGITAERGRAAIWEVEPATGRHRVFASGLRNPVGMDFEPVTGALWAVVNERDELGSDLVPDYLTEVRDGAFYGWPWSYWGDHVDGRVEPQRPDRVEQAVVPDYALGAHVAPLGLAFTDGNALPERFAYGAFVGEHGSWNREPPSGYQVVFVPFEGGRPAGRPLDVLTGFLGPEGEARGRPVGVAVDRHGALLVADDVGNRVWRVTAAAPGGGA
ncbi:MAG TPA: sorbosone dehydrogenase family protein [Geminicoccaceae bacterium]